ncbi:MAG: VWA domain-containing protein [Candidatus Nomurabacteria bacterium]|nr:VWA domain-containing protein [Candidatus Nomurabacteria bacterium]
MKNLIVCLVLSAVVYFQAKAQDCISADIVMLVDWSGSLEGYEGAQMDACKEFVSKFDLKKERVRFALVSFYNFGEETINHKLSSDKKSLLSKFESMKSLSAGGSSYMEGGISLSRVIFQRGNETRTDNYQKIIIIISDGDLNDSVETYVELLSMTNQYAVRVISLYMGNYNNDSSVEFMKSIATPGNYFQTSYKELAEFLKDLDLCL